jgi:hypothetical protein
MEFKSRMNGKKKLPRAPDTTGNFLIWIHSLHRGSNIFEQTLDFSYWTKIRYRKNTQIAKTPYWVNCQHEKNLISNNCPELANICVHMQAKIQTHLIWYDPLFSRGNSKLLIWIVRHEIRLFFSYDYTNETQI